jgi:hypothetical protein
MAAIRFADEIIYDVALQMLDAKCDLGSSIGHAKTPYWGALVVFVILKRFLVQAVFTKRIQLTAGQQPGDLPGLCLLLPSTGHRPPQSITCQDTPEVSRLKSSRNAPASL